MPPDEMKSGGGFSPPPLTLKKSVRPKENNSHIFAMYVCILNQLKLTQILYASALPTFPCMTNIADLSLISAESYITAHLFGCRNWNINIFLFHKRNHTPLYHITRRVDTAA
jgi:hypothetical protein